MAGALKALLKQNVDFKSKAHEASLGLIVAGVHTRRRADAVFKVYDLNFSYYNVLRILRGAPSEGHPRCYIIERMIDPAPDVTRLIDQLINKGWVRRERSEVDRRQSLHWITEKGLRLIDEIDKDIEAMNDRFASTIGEADLDHLIRITAKVFESTDDDSGC